MIKSPAKTPTVKPWETNPPVKTRRPKSSTSPRSKHNILILSPEEAASAQFFPRRRAAAFVGLSDATFTKLCRLQGVFGKQVSGKLILYSRGDLLRLIADLPDARS